ncbi:MAG: autotransporter domain-containing protein [Rhizobiaceae bacterium]|nr:autotransporter domain-containing protein [Rhizobiaceae bacterium]
MHQKIRTNLNLTNALAADHLPFIFKRAGTDSFNALWGPVRTVLSATAIVGSTVFLANAITIASARADCSDGIITIGESSKDILQTVSADEVCTIEAGAKVEMSDDPNFPTVDNGIAVQVHERGTIVNNGEIHFSGDVNDNETGSATHTGILIRGNDVTIINNDLISSSNGDVANGDVADGIVDWGSSGGHIENHGSIKINGVSGHGISVFQNYKIINTGLIESVDYTGNNTYLDYGSGHGIGFDNGNTVYNSGEIHVVGNVFTSGVYSVGGDNNTLYNSGLIKAIPYDNVAHPENDGSNNDNPFAIHFTGKYDADPAFQTNRAVHNPTENGKFILFPGSVIVGRIGLFRSTENIDQYRNDHTLEVHNGLSVVLTFSNTGYENKQLYLPGTIESLGAPQFTNVDSYKVVVIDPTLHSINDEVISDLLNGVHGSVGNRLTQIRNSEAEGDAGGNGQGNIFSDRLVWLNAFGSRREQEGESAFLDTEIDTGGFVAGIDGMSEVGIRFGAYLGTSENRVEHEYGTQEEDLRGFFGGLYGNYDFAGVALDAMITGGFTNHHRKRQTNNNVIVETEAISGDASSATGMQTAIADYKSYFIAPEMSVVGPHSIEDNITVSPSAHIRYVGYFLDGFAESDAGDNYMVKDRELHLLQGRLQLEGKISLVTDSGDWHFAPRIGVEYQSIIEGNSFTAKALGQSYVDFEVSGDKDKTSKFAGIDIHKSIADQVEFRTGIEAKETNDSQVISAQLGLTIKY